jgi:hypothetical protein
MRRISRYGILGLIGVHSLGSEAKEGKAWLRLRTARDLPDPLPLRKIIGASVIILATALGSGELILWPYIVTQVGIGILWLAAVGFTMQFFLNMEIERYTLATGETAVAGFTRFWKPWGIIFILMTVQIYKDRDLLSALR